MKFKIFRFLSSEGRFVSWFNEDYLSTIDTNPERIRVIIADCYMMKYKGIILKCQIIALSSKLSKYSTGPAMKRGENIFIYFKDVSEYDYKIMRSNDLKGDCNIVEGKYLFGGNIKFSSSSHASRRNCNQMDNSLGFRLRFKRIKRSSLREESPHFFLVNNRIRVGDMTTLEISRKSCDSKSFKNQEGEMCILSSSIKSGGSSSSKVGRNEVAFIKLDIKPTYIKNSLISNSKFISKEFTVGLIWRSEEENMGADVKLRKHDSICIISFIRIKEYYENGNKYHVIMDRKIKRISSTSDDKNMKAIGLSIVSTCDFICVYYKDTFNFVNKCIDLISKDMFVANIPVFIEIYRDRDFTGKYDNVRELTSKMFNENIFTLNIYDIKDLVSSENYKTIERYASGIIRAKWSILKWSGIIDRTLTISNMTCSNLQSGSNCYFSVLTKNIIRSWSFTKEFKTKDISIPMQNPSWYIINEYVANNINESCRGGFIFHEKGIFNNVASFDFTSCYPKVIIDNNLCFSNCFINPSDKDIKKFSLIKRCDINVNPGFINLNGCVSKLKGDRFYSGKVVSVYTPTKEKEVGILPRILSELYEMKSNAKGNFKGVVKLLMNSLYGILGKNLSKNNYISRRHLLFSKILAFAACKIQRKRLSSILNAINHNNIKIKSPEKYILKPVCGHTDNIMISFTLNGYSNRSGYFVNGKINQVGILNYVKEYLSKCDEKFGMKSLDWDSIHIENIFKVIAVKNSGSYIGLIFNRANNSRDLITISKGFSNTKSAFVYKSIIESYTYMLNSVISGNINKLTIRFNSKEMSRIPFCNFLRRQKFNTKSDYSDSKSGYYKDLFDAYQFVNEEINNNSSHGSVSNLKYVNVKKKNSRDTCIISNLKFNKSEYSIDYRYYVGEIKKEIEACNELIGTSSKLSEKPTKKIELNGYIMKKILKKTALKKKDLNDNCIKCKKEGLFNMLQENITNRSVCDNVFCPTFSNKLFF